MHNESHESIEKNWQKKKRVPSSRSFGLLNIPPRIPKEIISYLTNEPMQIIPYFAELYTNIKVLNMFWSIFWKIPLL